MPFAAYALWMYVWYMEELLARNKNLQRKFGTISTYVQQIVHNILIFKIPTGGTCWCLWVYVCADLGFSSKTISDWEQRVCMTTLHNGYAMIVELKQVGENLKNEKCVQGYFSHTLPKLLKIYRNDVWKNCQQQQVKGHMHVSIICG